MLNSGPARVADVDRHVGLDERHQIGVLHDAALARNDARGDRVLEAERRADGDHPLADLELGRVAELDAGSGTGRFDLDQRDVGALVAADDLRLELALVGELDGNLIGAFHRRARWSG
jgi:hypothetical protein